MFFLKISLYPWKKKKKKHARTQIALKVKITSRNIALDRYVEKIDFQSCFYAVNDWNIEFRPQIGNATVNTNIFKSR